MKITTKCRESDKTLKEIFAREPSSKDKEIKKSAFRYILQERCGQEFKETQFIEVCMGYSEKTNFINYEEFLKLLDNVDGLKIPETTDKFNWDGRYAIQNL